MKVGKKKVIVQEEKYKVKVIPSRNVLLKVIIQKSHLDSNATTTSIRDQLSSLDKLITTVGCNITQFNAHVKGLLEGLASPGQITYYSLSNLFKGYAAASNKTFVKYIKQKQEKYKDSTKLDLITFMSLTDKKYKTLLIKGTWNAPS